MDKNAEADEREGGKNIKGKKRKKKKERLNKSG